MGCVFERGLSGLSTFTILLCSECQKDIEIEIKQDKLSNSHFLFYFCSRFDLWFANAVNRSSES